MKVSEPQLITEAVMAAIGRKLDQTTEQKYLTSLRNLSRGEHALWFTFIVQCEVENGGFAQYFWNMESEEFYGEAAQGFAELGATQHLAVFNEALRLISPHLPAMHAMQGPEDRFKKYKPLLKKTGLYDLLTRLDARFYELRPSIADLRERYISQHHDILPK
jgi:hypothetical protein